MLGGIIEAEDECKDEIDSLQMLVPMSDKVRLCIEKAMKYEKEDRQQSIDEFLEMLPS
jgi:hypothetical protein